MFDIRKIHLPQKSGCYLMKNRDGEIIYIGKAKNLRSRVSSYFRVGSRDWKTDEMVPLVADIELIITRNEVEALILEARLIRQHKPRFNLMLKENQPYFYIKITDEEFSRLERVREIKDKGKYFGPYVSGRGSKYLLLTVARLFGLRTGKFTSRSSRELYRLLSEIKDREWENMLASDYRCNVKLAEMFLRGRKAELITELEKRMKQAATEANFELAKLYRDQIRSIKIVAEDQLMSLPKNYDQDVINYVVVGGEIYFQVFNVSKGVVTSRNELTSRVPSPESRVPSILDDFVKQYYLTRSVPEEIVIPERLVEAGLIKKYLEELKGSKVEFLVPQKGDKKKILDLVRENILIKLVDRPEKELQARLSLPQLPLTIDGFDISNTSGLEAVGSCVRFQNGQPDKNLYRKFKIKTVTGSNDYAMMLEVISRRYQHAGWGYPDLILVDGGRGQLNIALRVLAQLKLNIPVVSLAKREEEVYLPTEPKPVWLERSSGALKLLQRIRDEAHRFAIGYHKLLRRRR